MSMSLSQVNELVSLTEYLTKHHKTKKKFKNDKERKAYIQKELGLTVQKDRKNGHLSVPVATKTLMLEGVRMSASRVKEEEHDDRDACKDAFKKAAEGLEVKTNTQDSFFFWADWLDKLGAFDSGLFDSQSSVRHIEI